ncbi:hypothetical protein KQX54_011018 [Cotesia glomerata]|uniref:Uncharacterized protein n=1 Tax=Cotesia glomerata TaxID=32391 RepID=A0AAV7J7Y0_COTGL|nr:hypothetical protein KQX54_011018 [Cotesia glomerata]
MLNNDSKLQHSVVEYYYIYGRCRRSRAQQKLMEESPVARSLFFTSTCSGRGSTSGTATSITDISSSLRESKRSKKVNFRHQRNGEWRMAIARPDSEKIQSIVALQIDYMTRKLVYEEKNIDSSLDGTGLNLKNMINDRHSWKMRASGL